MNPKGINWMSTRFYKKLRKLNDKKNVSHRELLGLYFDLYELFMAISEENNSYQNMMEAMRGGMPRMMELTPEAFEEVVKRDKKATAEKLEAKKGEGQYL